MLSVILLCAGAASALQGAPGRGFERLLDAVVRIDVREASFDAGTRRFSSSIGSGVIIAPDGLVVTNAHVVGPKAVEINVTLANLERVGAQLVGWDHWTDLAVLRIDMDELRRRGLKFSHAKLGRSDQLRPGATVYAVGTPFGLTRTVTRGIISNPRRYFEDSRGVRGYETGTFNTWLQTDAAINPGNSGGPLVTENGEVVGINSRSYLGADNLAFAIPAEVARRVVEGLVGAGTIPRSYIGLVPGVLQDLETFYALEINTGMLINSVENGSPAALAGLRGGDILLTIDGRKVDGRFPEQLPAIQHAIASRAVGSSLQLAVKRGGETLAFTVVTEPLVSRVGEEESFESWGLTVRKVSRTYARENQLTDDTGMIVLGVRPGYPAAVAGLTHGAVITKINRQPITDLEVARQMHDQYAGNPAPTLVETIRQHRVALYVLKP